MSMLPCARARCALPFGYETVSRRREKSSRNVQSAHPVLWGIGSGAADKTAHGSMQTFASENAFHSVDNLPQAKIGVSFDDQAAGAVSNGTARVDSPTLVGGLGEGMGAFCPFSIARPVPIAAAADRDSSECHMSKQNRIQIDHEDGLCFNQIHLRPLRQHHTTSSRTECDSHARKDRTPSPQRRQHYQPSV